jgi:hypothetical protein
MLNKDHISVFRNTFLRPPEQLAIGDNPLIYLNKLNELCNLNLVWPKNHPADRLTRSQLRLLSRDNEVDVRIAYAAIMAWGGRGVLSRNYRLSLNDDSIVELEKILNTIRNEKLSRLEAFRRMQVASQSIKGLGISFYTKLLFFMRLEEDAYILDQFTAKSAHLLFSNNTVRLTSQGYPHPTTTPEEYEKFCLNVEVLNTALVNEDPNWSPDKVELAMFDIRGGDWRRYLRSFFKKKPRKQSTSKTDIEMNQQTRAITDENRNIQIRELAKRIKTRHIHYYNHEELELPEMNGNLTCSNPLRLHCYSVNGITWQYSFQKKSVHAQVFIPKTLRENYDRLCRDLDVINHDFGDGISGTGWKSGRTCSVKLTHSISFPMDDRSIDEDAEIIVRNMSTLYNRIGEYI